MNLQEMLEKNEELVKYMDSIKSNPYIARNALGHNTVGTFIDPILVVQGKQTLMEIENMSKHIAEGVETNKKLMAIIENLSNVIETHLKTNTKAPVTKKK